MDDPRQRRESVETIAIPKSTGGVESAGQSLQPIEFTSPKPIEGTRRRVGAFRKIAQEEWAPALLIMFCDVICWIGLYNLLGFIRHDQYFSSTFEFAIIDIIQLAVIIQALFVIGGYSQRTETRGLAYTAEHILAMMAALAISSLLLYTAATFDRSMKPSRGAVLISFLAFTPISLLYRRALRAKITAAAANRAYLVIGAGELASDFYKAYSTSDNEQRLEFVDLDETRIGQPIAGQGSPIVEGDLFSKLSSASTRYSGIILAERLERIRPELLDNLVRTQFQRMRVYTLESFYEAHWRHVPVHSIDPFWPLQTGFQLSRTSPYHYLKRLFDMIAAVIGLIVCSPVMLVAALLIWVTRGRPIIFKQERVGRDDHLFTIYKFRTMRNGNDAVSGEIYTRKNDPRIFRVGGWLRKLRLDELPQLWNVLKGDISLIGPRAEWIECARRYRDKIPLYHFRHLVKPGITGWAQVNYPYGESDDDAIEKLKYDLYYIRHYSLKLDAMIVLKTIHTMLFGKGR